MSIVQFSSAVHGFLESAGTIKVAVQRTGNVNQPMVVVNYETRDQTAVSGDDYIATAGELQFAAGECIKDISVTLVDDNQWEPDETFDIVLSLPTKQPEGSKGAVLGDPAVSTITIINDDEPGVLVFSEEAYTVNEKDEKIEITVLRKNGSDGTVTCKYKTQDHSDKSAVAGHDYEQTEGTLVFDHGEISKSFTIKIMNDESYEKDEHFQVELFEATGGATFPDDSHGHTEVEVAIITIVNDQELKGIVDKISSTLNVNMDRMKLGSNNWGAQFSDALKVKPDDDDDDDDDGGEPTVGDYITHYIALPWKVIFALCPPADFGGGWLCFFCSLAMIGVVTGFIGDLAGLFGCVIGLKDSVTAITFVALGTSLPDTFASMAAATQDPYADASIGNVTGSNSVNVFLGLGLPWMLASVYWTSIKKEDNAKLWSTWTAKYSEFSWFAEFEQADKFRFVVPAGSLGFSVAVFSSLAVSCILFLLLRRKIAGGELGGPEGLRWVSFALLVTFWFTYIILSSLKAYEII